MKKRKNIPAIICLSIACVLLVLSGMLTVLYNPELTKEETAAQEAEAQKILDSSLSDASRINVIADEPTPKPAGNSFDFSGKIVDGKVQGAEKSQLST
ncbi:MAG: hypothetical protein IJD86_05595, partial [Clostridia bacterium]|nr:hypothetical protein [Clostridia bacterium]